MLPAITVESLKEDKGFSKAAKKYGKEYDGLQKKQNKERNSVSANQCKAMEKLVKSKKYVYFLHGKIGSVALKCNTLLAHLV